MAEAVFADWSPRQRELLRAMGHPLWRLRTAASPAASAAATESGHRLLARRVGDGGSVTCVLTGPLPDHGSPAHRLLLNLLRAAGLSADPAPSSPSAATLEIPPLSQLLTRPEAKRSLWPALRAMRRAGGCGPGA